MKLRIASPSCGYNMLLHLDSSTGGEERLIFGHPLVKQLGAYSDQRPTKHVNVVSPRVRRPEALQPRAFVSPSYYLMHLAQPQPWSSLLNNYITQEGDETILLSLEYLDWFLSLLWDLGVTVKFKAVNCFRN